MGWWSRMRQGLIKQDEQTLTEITESNLATLSRVDAAREVEAREIRHMQRIEGRAEAADAVAEARAWLETHPNTHSARRGDVRRLIRAVESLDDLLVTTTTYDVLHEGLTANQKVAEGIV